MSAKFVDMPADEWEQKYCGEELAAERKADKKERGRVSALAFSLTSLLEAGRVSRDVFQAIHIFLSKSKYHAPDEPVKFFSEREAGALLPGDAEVADESMRKRFVRAWGEIEAEQARTGKRFCGRREKGSIQLASRKADEKKKGPEYYSQIAQAVLDVERAANRLRGSREDRFRRAGVEVWASLPAFYDDITIHPEKPAASSKGQGAADSTPKHSRRLDRFVRAAQEMLREAKKRDNETVEATGKELALELCKVFAEAMDVEPESVLRLLAETLMEAADAPVHSNEESSLVNTTVQSVYEKKEKVRSTSENLNPRISEQKHENDSPHVYEPVHVEAERPPSHRCPSPDVDPVEIEERAAVICEAGGVVVESDVPGFEQDAERRADAIKQARRDLCEACRGEQLAATVSASPTPLDLPPDLDPDYFNIRCAEIAESRGISQREAAWIVIAEHKAAFADQTVRDGGSA